MPLLTDLQAVLRTLEADLLERSDSDAVPEVRQALYSEYRKAQEAKRTAQSYETWRADYITQVAAAWVLSCVFARFLEDNRLIDPPTISGPGERLVRARDEHELYFRAHPTETDREYLLHTFHTLSALPGASDIFGQHNPIHELPNWLSGDAAGELLTFFQRIDAETGALVHDFTDSDWDTRFLGDLYQDLSEAARKKYALLQTPKFVEEFILDRTLEPALEEFGLQDFRMIDPACGSGHFLLGSFARLLDRWQRQEPGTNVRVLAQRALDSVCGVDVNLYAAAIARFRLLLVAMKESGIRRMADAPAFRIHVACGDSLIHGVPGGDQLGMGWHALDHVYQNEDQEELYRILKPGHYHAVVANPPYITVKDKALNDAYRDRYSACHRQYSLSVPFMQRIFSLAVSGGFTGQITANSFMKREFGKKLIEKFLPTVDLTHVIDTSRVHIPGHGTPTVILFGRHRTPINDEVRAALGIHGEPSIPNNPSQDLVWSAIKSQIDVKGSESYFVSVTDSPRKSFYKHPWSISGGGASELKEYLDRSRACCLDEIIDEVGFLVITGEDNCFLLEDSVPRRQGITHYRSFAGGESIRDWQCETDSVMLWPNSPNGTRLQESQLTAHLDFLWKYRTSLRDRKAFSRPVEEKGIPWWALREVYHKRLHTPLSIAFAFVATHNHFVLDRGGKVFNQSAPIIKLPNDATENDYLALLGLLNSSVAAFWIRQTCHDNGGGEEAWERRLQQDGTKFKEFPLPSSSSAELARQIDRSGGALLRVSPMRLLAAPVFSVPKINLEKRPSYHSARERMIALQEELDWQCYRLYKLLDTDLTYDKEPPPIQLGQRAFEIAMARKMEAGELETSWFERHGSTPITEIPAEWPDDYKQLVERRIELIQTDRNIGLIEQPEYKRRWNTEPWESQLERALRNWLLDRLESYFDFDGRMNDGGKTTAEFNDTLASLNRLADVARQDADFMQVAELYRDDPAFDVPKLVGDLVESESVPLLPVLRYKASGLRKRAEWERTWELQRQEDRLASKREDTKEDRPLGDSAALPEIPVPPKYTSSDFATTTYWRLRGKLDVPKERWVSFPHCEGADGTLMIAWAGYDHLQLALAISAHYVDVQDRLGGRDDPRLIPLLGCLIELLPWLKQWHNDVDPEFGMPMGDYFDNFVQDEARQMGKTLDEIKAWQASKKTTRPKRRKRP